MSEKYLLEDLLNRYLYSERPAGWFSEKEFSDVYKDFLCDDSCSSSRILPIEVLNWEEKNCIIFTDIRKIYCSIMPSYAGDEIIEGYLTTDLEKSEDKIVLLPTTDYPDNIWIFYNMAVEKRARAVIFYDYYPHRKRRIVVSGEWGYWYNKSVRPPIPVAHIRLEDLYTLKKMINKKISMYVSSEKKFSTGYIIEAYFPGRKDDEIIISAHHDSWFTGFRDDIIGVLTLYMIKRRLNKYKKTLENSMRLISFTAEEYGDPTESAWYWAYGSKKYLETYIREPDVPIISIVLDLAFKEPLTLSYSAPDLERIVRDATELDISSTSDYGSPYMDSISFIRRGLPTISLHNFYEAQPLYHTDLDIEFGGWHIIAEKIAYNIVKLADKIDLGRLKADILKKSLYREVPQKFRDKLLSIIEFSERHNKLYGLFSCFGKILLKPIVINSYRELYNDIVMRPMPQMILLTKKEVSRIIIPGEERIIDREEKDLDYIVRDLLNDIEMFDKCVKDSKL